MLYQLSLNDKQPDGNTAATLTSSVKEGFSGEFLVREDSKQEKYHKMCLDGWLLLNYPPTYKGLIVALSEWGQPSIIDLFEPHKMRQQFLIFDKEYPRPIRRDKAAYCPSFSLNKVTGITKCDEILFYRVLNLRIVHNNGNSSFDVKL